MEDKCCALNESQTKKCGDSPICKGCSLNIHDDLRQFFCFLSDNRAAKKFKV